MSSVLNYTLPDDWSDCELNSLIATDSNITYGVVQPGPQDPDGVPFVRGGDIYNGKIAIDSLRTISTEVSSGYRRTLLKGGELLMSLVGYPGEVAVVPRALAGANIARQAAYIKLGRKVHTRYVMYYLQSDIGKYFLFQKSTGSAQQVINLIDLKEVTVLFPPLPEQKKIASILTSVDDVIEKTESHIAKLQDLKTGMMQELLTKGIGPGGAPHTEFKDSPVGRIPVGWEVKTIGHMFSLQLGKMLSKAAKVGNRPLPYLGNKNVQWDRVDLTHLEQMDFSERERKKFSLKSGDLLMCEGGDVGRCAIWRGEMTDCYYQKAIHRLRPVDDLYEPVLLLEYMKFAKQRNILTEFISQTSIAHLTREKLYNVPVPVPPKNEQKQIVDMSIGVECKIINAYEKCQKIKQLKKALMQDLLTGKVRVDA